MSKAPRELSGWECGLAAAGADVSLVGGEACAVAFACQRPQGHAVEAHCLAADAGVREAEQLRFEERADVFSRYLPYAVVFGETDRWAHAFAGLSYLAGEPDGRREVNFPPM